MALTLVCQHCQAPVVILVTEVPEVCWHCGQPGLWREPDYDPGPWTLTRDDALFLRAIHIDPQ